MPTHLAFFPLPSLSSSPPSPFSVIWVRVAVTVCPWQQVHYGGLVTLSSVLYSALGVHKATTYSWQLHKVCAQFCVVTVKHTLHANMNHGLAAGLHIQTDTVWFCGFTWGILPGWLLNVCCERADWQWTRDSVSIPTVCWNHDSQAVYLALLPKSVRITTRTITTNDKK